MARIEGFTIRNYRALQDVTFGKVPTRAGGEPLPPMVAVIGPNGSGKSTVLDAFGFLRDCLDEGVEEACNAGFRGGFERLRTRGQEGAISLEIRYREAEDERPSVYTIEIDADEHGRPIVAREVFRQSRDSARRGQLFQFAKIEQGKGFAWAGELRKDGKEGSSKVSVKLDDPRRLAITSLGNLKDHPRITRFREFLEGWYLSYFRPDLARDMPMAGAQRKLNKGGDNLANFVQFLEREQPDRFALVLDAVASKVPGIEKITHTRAPDGRLLLQFNDRGYTDPFYAPNMSDGTLKYFAYMLMLEDPEPAPLIGIEEPENGLHHQLLEPLAREMRSRADKPDGPQVFVTTHANYFVDGLRPEEVFVLAKNEHGFSTVRRAADDPAVVTMVEDGLPLGSLWYSNHLGGHGGGSGNP